MTVEHTPNGQQQAAIQAGAGRIMLVAGPGTGKSFVIASRICRLLENGESPEGIVVITSGDQAAGEMKSAVSLLSGEKTKGLFIGTFHSFCIGLLKDENSGIEIAGIEERDRVLSRLFPDHGEQERSMIHSRITAHFLAGSTAIPTSVQLYVDELLRLNLVDTDAVIPVLSRLVGADERYASLIRGRVRHLLVDDFQETARSQFELVQIISEFATVFVTGDPDQAICGFRGSDLRFFFAFAEVSGTLLMTLKTTYRLTRNNLQAANLLISRNLIRSGLELESLPETQESVIERCELPSTSAEAEFIARRISELLEGAAKGSEKCLSPRNLAVFFRLTRQAEEIAVALERRGIPFCLIETPFGLPPSTTRRSVGYNSRLDSVSLMTCHSAKGLEFEVAFIAGLEEGIFPCTLMGPPDVEEERRLFYVAMTRAKKRLILTSSRFRQFDTGSFPCQSSRFIGELPQDAIVDMPQTLAKTARQDNRIEQFELF